MKNNYKNFVLRAICLAICVVLLLSGCKPATPDDSSSKPVSSSEITTSSDNASSDVSSQENTSSEVSSKPSSNKDTSSKTELSTNGVVDGEITKSDAGALNSKSAALKGKNGKLTNFKVLTSQITAFKMLEFEFNLPIPEGLNVYKESDVDISIKMKGSNGKEILADAFYYEEYGMTDAGQLNKPTGKAPSFRFRVSPQGAGTWDFTVTATIKGKEVDSLSGYINVVKNANGSNLLKVEPIRKQNFITVSGDYYIPVGENIAWNEPITQTTRFGQYLVNQMGTIAEYGANFTRIWDYLDSGSRIKAGVYEMNQGSSKMWDYIFESAEDMGIYICFVLTQHGETSQTGSDARFDASVWHQNRGGYITDAKEFFTDRKTIDAFKAYVRYIVSRWGYSENIFTWELVNEIDLSSAGQAKMYEELRAWMKEITECVRGYDSYNHLVSTSVADFENPLASYNVFDFVNYHYYNYNDLETVASFIKATWQEYKRPVVIGEFGLQGQPRKAFGGGTKELTVIHQGNWLGVMGGAAGTGMNWWWGNLNEIGGQWCYQIVSEISKEIPWNDKNMFMVNTNTTSPSNEQIEALGYRGKDYAYIWFYDNKFTYKNQEETTFKNETASVILNDGTYYVRWVNTWTGVSIKKEVITTEDGYLNFTMPTWSKDVVVAITRN